jgi:transposase
VNVEIYLFIYYLLFKRSTVNLWLRRWKEQGSIEAHRRQNYKRVTTPEQDAAIIAAHSSDPMLSTRVSSATYNVSHSLNLLFKH